MLAAAAASGRPLIPVFVADGQVTGIGAAARWRWGQGLAAFARALEAAGLRLTLRRGEAGAVLRALLAETGAAGVWWSRLYDPAARARDGALKAALRAEGLEARSFPGHLLAEPWAVQTGAGGFFRVFTPFYAAFLKQGVPPPVPRPARLVPPAFWPASDRLEDWALGAGVNRGAAVLARYAQPGEAAAQARLDRFLAGPVRAYASARDVPGLDATSQLSENLAYGEIGPRRIWSALDALEAASPGQAGPAAFRRELGWRDFAHHLAFHTPHLLSANWRPGWDAFPWQGDSPAAEAWRRGQTGIALVDAGMRELYATGRMHNRVRMVAASFLTKHLLTHWRLGLDWFAQTLTDWDPASNALGWQWVAGPGPDAAPFFRIFNPDTQAERFDPEAAYRNRWLAGAAGGFYEAIPRAWGLGPGQPRPRPVTTLAQGRARALSALAAARPG